MIFCLILFNLYYFVTFSAQCTTSSVCNGSTSVVGDKGFCNFVTSTSNGFCQYCSGITDGCTGITSGKGETECKSVCDGKNKQTTKKLKIARILFHF